MIRKCCPILVSVFCAVASIVGVVPAIQAQSCTLSISPPNDTAYLQIEAAPAWWDGPPFDYSGADNPSFFLATIYSDTAGIAPGTYLDWCIDTLDSMSGNPNSYNAILYSSCDPNIDTDLPQTFPESVYVPLPVWHQLNYLINHQNGAYFYDVQVAIWEVLGEPIAPDLLAGPTVSPYYPPVTNSEVAALVTAAQDNAAAWQPVCGDVIAVIVAVGVATGAPNDQLTIIEVPYTIPITLTNVPPGGNLGCVPTSSVPLDTTVTNGITNVSCCGLASLMATHVDSNTVCNWTRTFTITASDTCGNTASTNVIYTWTVDTTPPTITSVPAGGYLGCNPISIPTVTAANVHATDNCGGTPTVMINHQQSTVGCLVTSTFTVTVTDACLNHASTNVTYTWTADTTTPVLSVTPGSALGCNPKTLPTTVQYTVTDTCTTPTVKVTYADTTNVCAHTRIFTVIATNACSGNSVTGYATFTWTVNTVPPTLKGVPAGGFLGCGSNNVPSDTTVSNEITAAGQCGSATFMVTHQDMSTTCLATRTFTITATDGCENMTTTNLVYTWTVLVPITTTNITTNITTKITITTNSCTNEICGNFNTQNPWGCQWVWVNSHINSSPGKACTVYCKNATITLSCHDGKTYTFPVPNGQINFSPTCNVATNWFDGKQWNTTLPCSGDQQIFLQGCAIPWQSDFANCQSVCWTGVFSCSTPGYSCDWQWGAACYNNSQPSCGSICPKACYQTPCQNGYYYNWNDNAGCPENCKPYCVAGGTGNGGGNCTGSWCGTSPTCICGGFITNTTYITNYTTNTTTTLTAAPPVLIGVPMGTNLGCNPTNIPAVSNILAEVSASDTCSPATVTVTVAELTNICTVTQTFTITATNECGSGVEAHVTNTWNNMRFTNSICGNFNSQNPGNGWVWCNAHLSCNPGTNCTIYCQNASITLTCNDNKTYTFPVPDCQVNFRSNCTSGSCSFNGTNWATTLPCAGDSQIFLSGCGIPWQSDFANCRTVCWTGTFSCDTVGVNCNWQWGAACYKTSLSNCGSLGIKPCQNTPCGYNNGDQCGTPENCKNSCQGGACGYGGSNCTGNWCNPGYCSFSCN